MSDPKATPSPPDATTTRIRQAVSRSVQALTRRPILGRKTVLSRTRVCDGLLCETTEGRWTLTSDLSDKSGGTGAAPDAGVLARAALGSCIAMSYVLWAARRDVPLSAIEVDVETDFDAGGQYGFPDRRAGFTDVRYHVSITSSAPRATVLALLDEADASCPTLDLYANPTPMTRRVSITSPSAAEDF